MVFIFYKDSSLSNERPDDDLSLLYAESHFHRIANKSDER